MTAHNVGKRICAKTPRAMLAMLAQYGPMERAELARLVKAWDGTVKAYANDLRNAGMLHIVHRRRDEFGLEVPTYAYGPGQSAAPLPRMNGASKRTAMVALEHQLPLPRIPAPLPIEAWALRIAS